jgi:parallel beta-helix repeat protein
MLRNKQTKLNIAIWLTVVALAVLSLPIAATAQDVNDFIGPGSNLLEVPNLLEEPQIPGTVEGSGTYFEVNDSNYLNITFESTELVNLVLESVPEMVVMDINAADGATSTAITLGGLEPLTTYYKYEDDYHNGVSFTTDDNGSCAYTQDLSQPHLVFIQPSPGTIFLSDTGWSKPVGDWKPGTKTATLTQNVYETIQIDSNGITLNGNGFSVIGPGSFGVHLYGRTDVTIKNLTVEGFSHGIYHVGGQNTTLTDNTASNNSTNGIYLSWSTANTLTGNITSNNSFGIHLNKWSNNNTLTGNTANSNYTYGILLRNYSSNNNLTNNSASSNNGYGIRIQYDCQNNTLANNSASSNNRDGIRIEYNCQNHTLANNTVSDNGQAGIWIIQSDGSTLTDNTTSNNQAGIFLGGNSNTLTGNTISNNELGFGLGGNSNDNQFYNNNLIDNTIQAWIQTDAGIVFNQPAPIGGNYWSDWTGPDDDGDGFVDYPYTFDFGRVDNLPWARQNGWSPPHAIQALVIQVLTLNLQQGIENSLDAKLDAALGALDDINQNNDVGAINTLQAFIHAVEAQGGDKIEEADANALIVAANQIIAVLNAI